VGFLLTFSRKNRRKNCDESMGCGLCIVVFIGRILSVGEGFYFAFTSLYFCGSFIIDRF
jgi:hypothetical protein